MNDDFQTKFQKTGLRIVHLHNEKPDIDFYYPPECYTEDFELDKIETMNLLKEFRPEIIDN